MMGFAEKFRPEPLAGRHLIAGLSGGADSMSLVHFLAAHRAEWSCTLEAVHINHCLRGAESERDEAQVRTFCRSLDIPLTVERAEVAALARETGCSEETCGREVRYRAFARAAKRAKEKGLSPVIVTAHTLSDDLETMLLHLVRGCGLDGLTGIPFERDADGTPLVRPMLAISRAEVEQYCAENHLPYVTDSTNGSDAYARNRIRLQVLPELKKLNPALEETWRRMRENLSADRRYLSEQADALLERAETQGGWDAAVLSAADPALRSRAEAAILRRNRLPVDSAQIARLDRLLLREIKGFSTGGVRFQLRGGRLTYERACTFSVEPAVLPVRPLPAGGKCCTFTVTGRPRDKGPVSERQKNLYLRIISVKEYADLRKVYKKLLYFAVDYDTIKDSAVIRTRAPGDFYRLPGDGGRKLLKKSLQEAHLSSEERETLLLLAQEREVLWAEGFSVGEAFRPGSQTTQVLIGTAVDPDRQFKNGKE